MALPGQEKVRVTWTPTLAHTHAYPPTFAHTRAHIKGALEQSAQCVLRMHQQLVFPPRPPPRKVSSRTRTRRASHMYTHVHTRTLTHAHALALTQTYAHAYAHTHIHTLSQTLLPPRAGPVQGRTPSLLVTPSHRLEEGKASPLRRCERYKALLFGAQGLLSSHQVVGRGWGNREEQGSYSGGPGCARLNLWGQQLRNNSWSLGCGTVPFPEVPSAPHLSHLSARTPA